jgi:hypothetical protein
MSSTIPELLFQSMSALRAEHRGLQKIYRDQGISPAMVLRIQDFIRRGRATGAILDNEEDQAAVQALLDFWGTCLYRDNHPVPDTTLAPFDSDAAPTLADSLAPYVGLGCFSEGNKELFFGRDAVVASLIERLRQQNLLAISGPSGSGKSSLALAGIIPALKTGALPGSEGWQYLGRMVPGSNPFENLSKLLLCGNENGSSSMQALAERLKRKPDSLREVVATKGDGTAVLVIDQFEELSTLCENNVVRETFEKTMVSFVGDSRRRHILILTMRSDFIGAVARQPELQNLLETGLAPVTPLSASELREAISRPAERVGLKFETGVVESLVHDILGEPAALPLLQFTLLKLWEQRDHNRITVQAYRELGGGRLALTRSADRFIISLIPQERIMAERILLRLVRPGIGQDNVANRIRKIFLYSIGPKENVNLVLDKLVRQNLVRLTPGEVEEDTEVEVAHEALVRNWQHLVSLLENERERMTTLRRLEIKAADWVRLGRGTAGLLKDAALIEAEEAMARAEFETLGASNDLHQLVNASRHSDIAARRRASFMRVALVVLTVASVAFAIVAFSNAQKSRRDATEAKNKREDADRETKRANDLNLSLNNALAQTTGEKARAEAEKERAEAGDRLFKAYQMATAANDAVAQDPEQASLLALEAAGLLIAHPQISSKGARDALSLTKEIQNTLSLTGQSNRVRLAIPVSGEVTSLAFSPDGLLLAGAGKNEPVRIWDAITGQELKSLATARNATAIAFSYSGQEIAIAFDDRFQILNAFSGSVVGEAHSTSGVVRQLVFSPNDNYVAALGSSGNVDFWLLGRQSKKTFSQESTKITAIAFNPTGRILAMGGEDGSVKAWDVDAEDLVEIVPKAESNGPAMVNCLAFSTDGESLQISSADGQKHLAFSADEPSISRLGQNFGQLSFGDKSLLAVDVNGNNLIKSGSGGTITIPVNLSGAAVAFSLDGNRFAAAFQGAFIKVWDTRYSPEAGWKKPSDANNSLQKNVPDLIDRAVGRLTQAFQNSNECINKEICPGLLAAIPAILDANRLAKMGDNSHAFEKFKFALQKARWLSRDGKESEWAQKEVQLIHDQMSADSSSQRESGQLAQARAMLRAGKSLGSVPEAVRNKITDPQSVIKTATANEDALSKFILGIMVQETKEHLTGRQASQVLDKIQLDKIHRARKRLPRMPFDSDPGFNNTLCRLGSFSDGAFFQDSEVQDACERAVFLSRNNSQFRLSRGVNLARNKDYKGAIEDLQRYAKDSKMPPDQRQMVKGWITSLDKSKDDPMSEDDPFTPELLKQLRQNW